MTDSNHATQSANSEVQQGGQQPAGGQNPSPYGPPQQAPYRPFAPNGTAQHPQGAPFMPSGQPYPPIGQQGAPFQSVPFQQSQPYPPQGFYGYPQPQQRWNALCIIGFVLAFQIPPVGLILSIIALSQINRSHEQSKGLSIAGIIVSAINTFLIFLFLVIFISAFASAVHYNNTIPDCGYGSDICYEPDFDEYDDWSLQAVSDPLAAIPLLNDTQK